jgi:hypothetical protein
MSVSKPSKVKYIAASTESGNFVRIDAFEFHLTGEEQLLCHAIWKIRLQAIIKAEKSIELPYVFREPVTFEGSGITKPVNVGSPVTALEKDWGMHLVAETVSGDAEKRANEIAKRPGLLTFRMPRNEGIALLASLIWICNATGARPESITASEIKHKQDSKMEFLDQLMHDDFEVIEEEHVAKGFNKVQIMILRSVLKEMRDRLPDGTPAKADWMRSDEESAGEKIFQTQELILQCFPDPLDAMREQEMKEATEAINLKKQAEAEPSTNVW